MKHIFDTIPQWLVKGAKNAGRIKKEIKEKTPVIVSDIKDAYKEGQQPEPKQMDLFDDVPDKDEETGMSSIINDWHHPDA